jgi:thiol:disulfide interchange protein DsbC
VGHPVLNQGFNPVDLAFTAMGDNVWKPHVRILFAFRFGMHDDPRHGSQKKLFELFRDQGDEMKKLLMVLLLLCFAAPLHAADPLQQVKDMQVVKNLLGPHASVLEARDLGNIFEVVAGVPGRDKQLFYVTKDGSYLIAGATLFNKDRVDLTKQRLSEINKVDVSKLPLKDAIEFKKGNGTKKLIMFTDVDCPFCKQAYDWLKTQQDYTLYVFFIPLPMHPNAHEKSLSILCHSDPKKGFDLAESGQEVPLAKCPAGEKLLEEHKSLAESLGVTGTPMFVTDSGMKIMGFDQPAIEAYLKK